MSDLVGTRFDGFLMHRIIFFSVESTLSYCHPNEAKGVDILECI